MSLSVYYFGITLQRYVVSYLQQSFMPFISLL